MEVLGNVWYGSWKPLTNLTQTFQACHLCTFNVAAIFGGAIPTYGVLPYAMIEYVAIASAAVNESVCEDAHTEHV